MARPAGVKTRILIRTGRAASARRWADMLRDQGIEVWLAPDEIPQDCRPEVVVIDGDLGDGRQPCTTLPTAGAAPALVATVRIGGHGPADVKLPKDVTARELRLACRLLAEIVRLRRRERSGAELHRRLSAEALADPLTGLPNRRAWDQTLAERLAAAGRSPGAGVRQLCLAIFDLDHFKRINDAYGHAVGDEVLRATGRAIGGNLREEDFVARLGGDEFGLLLCVPNESTAAAVVNRVRTALPSLLVKAGTQPVSASVGYHLCPLAESSDPPSSPETLYAAAAAALRKAKRQGRDRMVTSAPASGR